MDKITIVTVTFNCCDSIRKTIKSVLSQDYPNIEYIVIDGNSNDGTKDVISNYIDKITTFVSEPDKGIYDGMNKALERATGEWIMFLNSGDVFYKTNTLSNIFMNNLKETDVCWGDCQVILDNKVVTCKYETPFFKKQSFFHGMGFSHQSVFVRTAKAQELEFDLSFKCCADYNMMMQLYKKKAKFTYIPEIVSIVEGRGGFSIANQKTQMLDTARILGIENTLRFRYIFAVWQLKRLVKRILKK